MRRKVEMIDSDQTSADTRLADYLLDFNPVTTNGLTNFTIGGYFSRGRIWTLHSRFRLFDPVRRRAGLPADVGSLAERLGPASAVLTLVNTNPLESRDVAVQAGGYGEHRFDSVTCNGKTVSIGGAVVNVHLRPGAGAQLIFAMTRYANRPTFAMPWDRGWYPGTELP